jgi:hypothetical protein
MNEKLRDRTSVKNYSKTDYKLSIIITKFPVIEAVPKPDLLEQPLL